MVGGVGRSGGRGAARRRVASVAVVVVALALLVASVAGAATLEVIDQDGTPTSFSAHAAQELCFVVALSVHGATAGVNVSFEGPKGDLAAKTAFAGSHQPVCFTAPPVPEAGAWRGCDPPRETIPEAYLVTASFDRTGAGAEELEAWGGLEPASFVWKVERQVTENEPEPEDCQGVDGEWTWTFRAGTLNCQNLPMTVTLPGFSETVTIETDLEGLDGLRMTVTGGKAREQLVLIREADVRRKGRDVPAWKGYQNVSSLLEQGGAIRGKYSLLVLSNDRLEGKLEVKNARVQDDVCSIDWPFGVSR